MNQNQSNTGPKLFIVPTPIGHLEDVTFRAIRILKEVDLILAEDTRQTSKLLKHYDIHKPTSSYHQNNEHRVVEGMVARICNGEKMALVTDAGTPGISDPGFLIVRECIKNNIEVECLPGATAFVPALVNSGFPSDSFCFEGFLPHKKGRQKKLNALRDETRTMIFYESPYRLLKSLRQFMEVFGENRQGSVSRELTKVYEETKRGTLKELFEYFSQKEVKGEIVIVVGGDGT